MTYWLQTLRSWKRWTHLKSTRKGLNAKEVIFPKENGKFILPVADGRIKLLGGDQDLRTSTLVRDHPIPAEGHIDFLGEPEGSLPPPHDSFPDAGEATNDFWSMSGNFIYRHHVEPRVQLYSPREESFPIPLKYIEISTIYCTNLDVKQEKRIDDYWNVDGSRDLSDPWTGFTMPEKLRGIYFIDSEDKEFNETIKNARKKLETPVAPAMRCKTSKNSQHKWTSGKSNEIQIKTCVYFWKPVNPQDCVWENLCRIIMKIHVAGKGDNSLQHYNLVHKFIPVPQAMKIPAAKAAVDKEWGKIGKDSGVEPDESEMR